MEIEKLWTQAKVLNEKLADGNEEIPDLKQRL